MASLYSEKVKNLKRTAKVIDCDEWLHDFHERLLVLEIDNKRPQAELLEKDKKIEDLENLIAASEDKITSASVSQPRSWSSLFDKEEKQKRSTESDIIFMAKIREEAKLRSAKENNIVLSGLSEDLTASDDDRESDDWVKTCDLIKQITKEDPNKLIKKVFRRGKGTRGVKPVAVEFSDQETRNKIFENAKNLKDDIKYGNVYINRDLTKNEIEEEKVIKKLKRAQ